MPLRLRTCALMTVLALPSSGTCQEALGPVEVTEVFPREGSEEGGTELTILGKNLGKLLNIYVNGRAIPSDNMVHTTPIRRIVRMPAYDQPISEAMPVDLVAESSDHSYPLGSFTYKPVRHRLDVGVPALLWAPKIDSKTIWYAGVQLKPFARAGARLGLGPLLDHRNRLSFSLQFSYQGNATRLIKKDTVLIGSTVNYDLCSWKRAPLGIAMGVVGYRRADVSKTSIEFTIGLQGSGFASLYRSVRDALETQKKGP